jgi:hypothetical protein
MSAETGAGGTATSRRRWPVLLKPRGGRAERGEQQVSFRAVRLQRNYTGKIEDPVEEPMWLAGLFAPRLPRFLEEKL